MAGVIDCRGACLAIDSRGDVKVPVRRDLSSIPGGDANALAPGTASRPLRYLLPEVFGAYAASIAFHLVVALVLFGAFAAGGVKFQRSDAPLTVRLMAPAAHPAPAAAPIVLPMPITPALPIVASPLAKLLNVDQLPVEAGVASPDAPAPVPPRVPEHAEASGFNQVDVSENYSILHSLQEELVLRTQGDYLVEVEKPVRMLKRPEVNYPPEALSAQRQGTVVAWIAINTDGNVDEVIISSGTEEFAEAVREALPSARFLPAEERGQIIPYYIVLSIDFRSGVPTTASTAVRSAPP